MKIYDISQEIFGAVIYPGDPVPKKKAVLSLENGDPCNLTQIELGSHTGSHADAPSHFLKNAKTVDQMDLKKCIGPCSVVSMKGTISASDLAFVLKNKISRLLIKGDILLSNDAAKILSSIPIDLIGIEGLSVGDPQNPEEVHLTLLKKEIVILEGLVLKEIPDGEYFLAAQPLKMQGLDGSPIRPVLLKF